MIRSLFSGRESSLQMQRPVNGMPVRRGILMVEVIVSALLIGTAMVVLLPGMVSVKKQRLDQRFEVFAMIEIHNAAEAVKSGNASPQLGRWFADRYRTASLSTGVLTEPPIVPEGSGLTAFRISISRPKPPGHPNQTVSQVIWVESEAPKS